MASLALRLLLLSFAATALAITAYVVGSFVLMQGHTGPRPWRHTLREALYEIGYALLTQPLLPLFYFIGRRLGGNCGRVPIIFIHGYAQNRVDFIGLALALKKREFGPLYGFNYPWFSDIRKSAERLGGFVNQVRKETGANEVDLIGHSLGGLVALHYMQERGVQAHVRRCVTIASPHGGIAWSGPVPGWCGPQIRADCEFLQGFAGQRLAVPVLSIASTHDNIVYPSSTSALCTRGGHDVIVQRGSHLSVLFHPEVAELIGRFLSEHDNPILSEQEQPTEDAGTNSSTNPPIL